MTFGDGDGDDGAWVLVLARDGRLSRLEHVPFADTIATACSDPAELDRWTS